MVGLNERVFGGQNHVYTLVAIVDFYRLGLAFAQQLDTNRGVYLLEGNAGRHA